MSIDYSHEGEIERDMDNQNEALWEIVSELREIRKILKKQLEAKDEKRKK